MMRHLGHLGFPRLLYPVQDHHFRVNDFVVDRVLKDLKCREAKYFGLPLRLS